MLLLALTGIPSASLLARETTESTSGCPPVGGLDYLLKQRTVLLLGEVHGTVESPQFVADLLCNVVASGHSATVALQLPKFESAIVDQYLDSAGSAADREELLTRAQELTRYQDGRFSEAMLGLVESIRGLRARGGRIDLQLFVPSDLDSLNPQKLEGSERPLAVSLWNAMTASEADLFVVLAGLTQSRVTQGTPLDPSYRPMGYFLNRWQSEWRLLSLALSHSGGTAWICTSRNVVDCRAVSLPGGGWGEPNSIYIYGEVAETGHDGVYFVGQISHSPPARPGMVEPDFEENKVTELPLEVAPNR